MNTLPTNHNGQETLSFSPYVSNTGWNGGGGDDFVTQVLRTLSRGLRPLMPSHLHERLRQEIREIFGRRVVDKHSLDAYGRPRILTGWKAVLHTLAWPAVAGVVLGYSLAIALVALHVYSMPTLKTQEPKQTSQQTAIMEMAS